MGEHRQDTSREEIGTQLKRTGFWPSASAMAMAANLVTKGIIHAVRSLVSAGCLRKRFH